MDIKQQAKELANLGRYEDRYLAHVAQDEMVIPSEIFENNPFLKARIYEEFEKIGLEPARFKVGNKKNSINPKTGLPEFFIKGIRKIVADILPGDTEKYLGEAVGILTGNPLLGAGATFFEPDAGKYGVKDYLGAAASGYLSPGIGSLGNVAKFGAGSPLGFLTGAGKTGAGNLSSFLFGTQGPAGSNMTQGILGKGGKMSLTGGTVGEAVSKVTDTLGLTGTQKDAVEGEVANNIKKGFGMQQALQLALITMGVGKYLEGETEDMKAEGLYDIVETDKTLKGFDKPTPIKYFSANGGLMSLAQGGFPRKEGKIEGPGTETSDDIPAMLSDGEFVVNARTVRGLGSLMGGRGKEQEREKGAALLYNMQDRIGGTA